MAPHPDEERLAISFSLNDSDLSIGIMTVDDVRSNLVDISDRQQASEDAVRASSAAHVRLCDQGQVPKNPIVET
jgi:hypothetical protein